MKTDKNTYQFVIVFQPKIAVKNRDEIVEKITAMLTTVGATLEKGEDLGTKELAYEIKGNTKGDFWQYAVNSTKTFNFNEVNLFLNRETQVIRYLVLKK